jgi:hypothetical protein
MVSGPTSASVHPATPSDFRTWQKNFRRKLRERPDSLESFSGLIKTGCDQDDLEIALFWIAQNLHLSKAATPVEIRDVFVLVDTILPKLEELRTNLDTLLKWHSQKEPVPSFNLYLDSVDYLFPQSRILTIPGLLSHLLVLLRVFQDVSKINTVHFASHAATVPEVLLIEYVRHATGATSEDEVTDRVCEHQRLAFEAYGVKGTPGRSYEGESWARRYRRFKKADPRMVKMTVAVVRDFVARKRAGEAISLIRFFIYSYAADVRSRIITGEPATRGDI